MEMVEAVPVSKIRNRDAVLNIVVPKILGILCATGHKRHGFGGCSVQLNETIVPCAGRIGAECIMLSVYDVVNSKIMKVFSAHVTDFPSAGNPTFYRYQDGRVGVMSWRRGSWEDVVMANEIAPQTVSEVFADGLRWIDNNSRQSGAALSKTLQLLISQ